jgi:hypothetical protein
MRPTLWLSLLSFLLLVPGPTAAGGSAPFRVHEWGTFTSFQGSAGGGLEGLQHEEERLPDFVYSRTEVRECPLRPQGYKGLEVPVERVTQKMETPVLYFHSDVARQVRVRVDFVGGLITQWYPVSDLLGPPEQAEAEGPLDLSTVKRSFLEWDVDVLPTGAARPPEVPDVADDDPWAFAREVDASWVRTRPREEPRLGPTEAERYLFYRGLGTFTIPLVVEARAGGDVVVTNGGDAPVTSLYALEVDEGGRLRFERLGTVAPGASIQASLAGLEFHDDVRELEVRIRKELMATGLASDEARAMVRTWSRSWFRSEGTRLVYVLPRAWTDALLPLSITPAPDELVRVLVGRLEYMTPEDEAEVAAALTALGAGDEAARQAAEARLQRLGRFLEPHLRRQLERTVDPDVRARAEDLLAKLGAR